MRPSGAEHHSQLPQRLGFDLPYTLPGDLELAPDFIKRVLPLADAVAQPDHVLLALLERRQRLLDGTRFVSERVRLRRCDGVFQENPFVDRNCSPYPVLTGASE